MSLVAFALLCLRHPDVFSSFDLDVYRVHGQEWREHGRLYEDSQLYMPYVYPPATMGPFALLSYGSLHTAETIMLCVNLIALTAVCALSLRRAAGLVGSKLYGWTLALVAVALWLEPVQDTLMLGQVNLIVLALVLWGTGASRWPGVGIGLAIGIKMTAGLFLVHLVLTRQWVALRNAVAAFGATAVVGLVLDPRASWDFWTGGFSHVDDRIADVAPLGYTGNQSEKASVLRTLEVDYSRTATVVWALLAAAVLAVGLWTARELHNRFDPFVAVCVVGLITLLVSPLSWSHHWVWVVPALVICGARSLDHRASRSSRVRCAILAVAGLGLLATWPEERAGRQRPLGTIWQVPQGWPPGNGRPEWDWSLGQAIVGNAYVLAGLAALIVLAWLAWTRRTQPAHRRQHLSQRPWSQGRSCLFGSLNGHNSKKVGRERAIAEGREP